MSQQATQTGPHLREKNRLLTANVKRLESEPEEKSGRIVDLEADIYQLRTELAIVRSDRSDWKVLSKNMGLSRSANQQIGRRISLFLTERNSSFNP
jgi:hypothetical protein